MNKNVVDGIKIDPYKVLGLNKKAKLKAIKKKYRELAMQYHPDKAPPGKTKEYTNIFREINEAYKLLTSPDALRQLKEYGYVMNFEEGQRLIQARMNVARMLDQAFDQYDGNYFELMAGSIKKNSDDKKSQIQELRHKRKRYEQIKKGIVKQKKNKDNDDIVFGVIDSKIDGCSKRIAFEENEIEIGKIMIKIVKSLRYEEKDETIKMLMGEGVIIDGPTSIQFNLGGMDVEL
jgi:curved DNA-binding protein CbpA